jgi:hypothetical protein
MLLTFSKPEFVNLIRQGIKICTIRQDRHHRWKAGMKIHFWMHNPRNVKLNPYPFGHGKVAMVEPISLYFRDDRYSGADGEMVTRQAELDLMAIHDGFSTWQEMKKWFNRDEFHGRLITWKDCEWY